jgi:fumarate hydratase class I
MLLLNAARRGVRSAAAAPPLATAVSSTVRSFSAVPEDPIVTTTTPAAAPAAAPAVTPFHYQNLFELDKSKDDTEYRLLTTDHVKKVEVGGKTFLEVAPEGLRALSSAAMRDIAHLLRPAHLKQLSKILGDAEATDNDKFVALELLRNANIASNFVLPGCQDTGTAIVAGKRGQYVLTDGDDEAHLSQGIYDTYTGTNLRYSQVAPLDMFTEANTKTNLPAQIDLYATKGGQYDFLFIAKGGGSANKTFLYQQTKALLNPASLMTFLEDNIKTIGTSACPPYHLAIVVGGLTAEQTLKTVKMASTKVRFYLVLIEAGRPSNQLAKTFCCCCCCLHPFRRAVLSDLTDS